MRRLLWGNPVLLRELRERVLSGRTMVMITAWISVLSAIVALYYASEVASGVQGGFSGPFGAGGDVLRLAQVGQNMFDWVLFFMIGLVLFLVPGFTAASIAGERERKTLLPMQVTLLRPLDIVIGKVSASVAFTLLLIALTAPILGFALLIGGVTLTDVVLAMAMVIFTALCLACITVACSAVVRRVPGAIITAYGVVLVLVLGSVMAWGVAGVVDSQRGIDQVNPPTTLLATNPFFAVADVSGGSTFGYSETPMDAARDALRLGNEFRDDFGNGPFPVDVAIPEPPPFLPGPNGELIPVPVPVPFPGQEGGFVVNQRLEDLRDAQRFDEALPFWSRYILVMGALSAASIWVASRRVRTPAKTER